MTPNRSWCGRYIRSQGSYQGAGVLWNWAWYEEPDKQPAVIDCCDPRDNIWQSSSGWLGAYIPDNHFGQNGLNVCLMDGHVEWRSYDKVSHLYHWGGVQW